MTETAAATAIGRRHLTAGWSRIRERSRAVAG